MPVQPKHKAWNVRNLFAILLSLCLDPFLADAVVSLVDNSLILFFNLHVLSVMQGILCLFAVHADAGMLRAGRAVLERIAEFTKARTDFAFETTLSGRSYVRLLRNMKTAGFRLHMFYLWIPSPELALLRIRYRVQSGGHNVPESEVRRRFTRSLGNLFRLYRRLLDTLHFFDNSSDTPNLIFKDEAGQTTINDGAIYKQLRGRFATWKKATNHL